MAVGQSYSSLPLTWNPKTGKNDQRWLRSIVQNSAPFSDGWTKARIVQLAHERPGKVKPQKIQELPEYGGYGSEAEIAEVLRSSLNLSEYSAFANQVNAEYVVKVLNSWHQQKFSQAVSRNFEVYADRERSNIFLVVSTAPTSLNAIRKLPPADRFRPLFNIKELGLILRQQQFKRLTLRTHGYSNPAEKFYDAFLQEAESISLKGPINYGGTLADQSAYIGYSWPGEEPFFTPGLWTDPRNNWEIFFKFLSVVALLAWIVGTVLYVLSALLIVPAMQWLGLQPILDPLWTWFNPQQIGSLFLQWQAVAFVVFALWLLLLQILRLVVYQRDRYRAIHYGAPDLAEFFWRLDKVLNDSLQSSMPFGAESLDRGSSSYLKVNLIGHSMGCLLVVNVLRILSDRFGKDDQSSDQQEEQIGNSLRLDHLILSSPDIPLEFLREGRNNYVRSAIRRCQQIYLISSDRDIVLRYLSMMGNWYSEPSLEMSGLRL
ncbi:MAG: alpha/beta hydrolase [Microcoleaceae cyanobacterium]